MEHTANFGLTQWEKTDRIQMEDFNADNAKLDAALSNCGNCRIVTGTYIGSGTYGNKAPTELTFDGEALAVLVAAGSSQMLLSRSCTLGHVLNNSINIHLCPAVWIGNKVSWYSAQNEFDQMNVTDIEYHYFALLRADV